MITVREFLRSTKGTAAIYYKRWINTYESYLRKLGLVFEEECIISGKYNECPHVKDHIISELVFDHINQTIYCIECAERGGYDEVSTTE